ncbi:expressed unknown protein [Seminavis robusta]|uniref:Uncharacterized protein n=1 Tax=Seminavis robusta TaxID=568900 RepID=A0A9N8DKT0_9STRA|nr:expressed unknown protein [Seminavis robusta]|eukprot:Sro209_g087440.1 n/a (624) ;mRNA; r:76155-78026
MIAFNASIQDDTNTGLFPLVHNTEAVLFLWAAAFACLTLLVNNVVIGCFEKLRLQLLPFKGSNALSIEKIHDTICPRRRARFFKCVKRCERRKSQQEKQNSQGCDNTNNKAEWNCPFECSFVKIRMPAPLPFRKKRRSKATRDFQPQTEVRATPHPPAEEIPASEVHAGAVVTSSGKSARRRRRKRLATDSSTETEASASTCSSGAALTIPSLPVSSTLVIDLAMMQNWPQLLVNLKADRRGARHRDADGLYPLHWAVSGAPPLYIVEALLRAYPGAVKKVDSEGSNALHFVSHYGGSVAAMELLLNAYPKAISVKDKYGRSPLYHAVDKAAKIDVLEVLAKADPAMVSSPCRPKNYKQLEQEGKSWSYLTPLYLAWANVLTNRQSAGSLTGKIFDKARLLLEIAYRHRHGLASTDHTTMVPLVAAIITLDGFLPKELAEMVIRKASENDLLELDPVSGRNPLALTAGMTNIPPQRAARLIRWLVEACPKAATETDREGRTALGHAAASGKAWEEGLETLFCAAPETLGWVDRKTGLPPPLVAATAPPSNQNIAAEVVMSADPYNLIGVKSLSLRRRASEQPPERDPNDVSGAKSNELANPDAANLSAIYQLMSKDPMWIVRA